MDAGSETRQHGTAEAWITRALVGGTVACLVGIGGVLWWRQGGAVFNEMVTSALAWCF